MRFASLGSGSQGNASLIQSANALLLLDCGFSLKSLTEKLHRLSLSPADLTAVLVTHEHADHIRGVGPLARKYNLPVYMTKGTASARCLGKIPSVHIIRAAIELTINDISLEVHAVPHDAREPVQFIFSCGAKRLGVLTDVGNIPDSLVKAYSELDALVVEANHDPEMLARGPYTQSLKQRVGGYWGHLSNQQCAELVAAQSFERLQHLIIAHISQKNNCPKRVVSALESIPRALEGLVLASQENGVNWRTLA